MKALLHRAFDLGINLFDTAREYLDSEVILGRALEDLPRADVVVSTKFAAVLAVDSGVEIKSAAEVVETVEESLSRLRLSEIDVVMVGGLLTPDNAAAVLEEQVPALERLRRQGKVRHVGSTEASSSDGAHDWLRHALPADVFDVVMVGHNMLNQSASRNVFPACVDRDVGVMNIYTSRSVMSDPGRLREVVADLANRGIVSDDVASAEEPLGWLIESGEAGDAGGGRLPLRRLHRGGLHGHDGHHRPCPPGAERRVRARGAVVGRGDRAAAPGIRLGHRPDRQLRTPRK